MQRRVFRFAEFTFDSDTGTLTRKSRGSRLPEKTARLLQILLERANTLVSRDELRQVLWPGEQFLDYDQGINVAVNRLRIALREGSRPSHFLKTIPKRGYSFCAQVMLVPAEIPGTAASPAISAFLPGEAPVAVGQERELDLIISDMAPIHDGNGASAKWSQAKSDSQPPHPAIADVREIASLVPHEFVFTAPAAVDAINRRRVLRRI